MIGNDYAEKCKIKEKESKYRYLPHHGVYHPQKLGKLGWCLIVVPNMQICLVLMRPC